MIRRRLAQILLENSLGSGASSLSIACSAAVGVIENVNLCLPQVCREDQEKRIGGWSDGVVAHG